MRRFWKKREERAEWPEPRTEFLQSLSDEIRGARGRVRAGGLRLAFVGIVILALLVPSAFAATSAKSGVRDAVKSVASVVQADSKGKPPKGKPGKGKHDDDDDDDDDDNGDYDYDKKCPNFGERRSALAHHQNEERRTLRMHQKSPHPGLSKKALRAHFKREWRALHAHQKAEREQLKKECGKGGGKDRHDDDDD